jgi:hypothetical protein
MRQYDCERQTLERPVVFQLKRYARGERSSGGGSWRMTNLICALVYCPAELRFFGLPGHADYPFTA